jgi:hypothetical protein
MASIFQKRGWNKLWLLLGLFIIIYPVRGVPMSLFSGEDVCVFSSMQGMVTLNGKPVAGAKLRRVVTWKDKKGESDSTETDAEGRFEFPAMMRTLKQMLPAQFVAHQSIYVIYNDTEYHIWEMGKTSKQENSELGHVADNLTCELTDELEPYPEAPGGLLLTVCKWDSM